QAGRSCGWFRGGRRDRRDVVQDRAGASGLYRAARLRGTLRCRRTGRAVELEPGAFRRPRLHGAAAPHETRRSARLFVRHPLCHMHYDPAEIGGAFGGKTVIYVEPVAVMLARKSGHPVKIVMSREDVFRATGPASGASMTVKIGIMRDGTIVAADGLFKLQAG